MTKHRNLKYDEQLRAARHGIPSVRRRRLLRAVSVAALGAHRRISHSISMAITWKTREVRRINDLHFFNSMLRGIGLPQQPPADSRCATR